MDELVPTVKSEPGNTNAGEEPSQQPPAAVAMDVEEKETAMMTETDRDMLCPICMQLIKDAYLTSCGHSFCYACIVTHLKNKSDCPCCSHFLTPNHLYPNFLLNKLLMKTSTCQIAKTASPVEHLHQALQQGYKVSVKELDSLLSLLAEKKRKLEQEESETNMQIILDFLICLRNQKQEELNECNTFSHVACHLVNPEGERGVRRGETFSFVFTDKILSFCSALLFSRLVIKNFFGTLNFGVAERKFVIRRFL